MCARAWFLFAANVPAHIRTHTRTRVVLDAATNTHKKHKFVIITTKDKTKNTHKTNTFAVCFTFAQSETI